MSLSLALLFGVMGLMNFAYGELIMAGGYTMFYTRDWGWLPMIVTTVIVVVVLSLLMELVAFRPLRNASPITLLVSSFAVSYGLQQLASMTVGQGPAKGVAPYDFVRTTYDVGGVLISRWTIVTIIVTLLLALAMTLLLRRTMLGIQLRASTEDFRMSQLVGVRSNLVIGSAFAITGVLAAAVAVLYFLRYSAVEPQVGQGPLLVAFVGGVIGGLGSLPGAAIGGFVLGAVINALQASLPVNLSSYTQLFAFAVVIAILVLLPKGVVSLPQTRLGRRLRGGAAEPPVPAAGKAT
jgi:branched-chain amino acid transport system permease protein